LLTLVLILSIYPAPPRPYSYVVYVFLGSVAAGVALSMFVRSRAARTASPMVKVANPQGDGVAS
jgi:hypothetical protein